MIKQDLILLKRPKILLCILDKNLVCETAQSIRQRISRHHTKLLPSYNLDLSRKFDTFYNCSAYKCNRVYLDTLILTDPNLVLIGCYKSNDCVNLKYHGLSTAKKLLLLNTNVRDKIFYTVDCLINKKKASGICFKRDEANTLRFEDVANSVMLDEANVLSPDALICEQSRKRKGDKFVSCNEIQYNPSEENLVQNQRLILKDGNSNAPLYQACISNRCGYYGVIRAHSFRRWVGTLFRCPRDKHYECISPQTRKPNYTQINTGPKILALKGGIYGEPYNVE